jgi:hypothetical protein
MRGTDTIASALALTTFAACNGGLPASDPTSMTLEEYEESSDDMTEPPRDPAANPDQQAMDECSAECLSSDDCCEGYYCGKDPQRSHRKDYCLPGG